MQKSTKVFMACALGALVGSLIALELNAYLWWMGMLAGGLVGYLSYEFKKVIEAVPKAWQRASSWRPDWQKIKSVLLTFMWVELLVITVSVTVLIGISGGITLWIGKPVPFEELTIVCASFIGILAFCAALGSCTEGLDEKEIKNIKKFLFRYNPISFYFWVLPKSMFWCLIRIPKALVSVGKFTGKFTVYLFRLIHSDERLLCGVDAGIGACIGYFSGNALIGALSGGLLGVLNYELVSKRLLRLAPNGN